MPTASTILQRDKLVRLWKRKVRNTTALAFQSKTKDLCLILTCRLIYFSKELFLLLQFLVHEHFFKLWQLDEEL